MKETEANWTSLHWIMSSDGLQDMKWHLVAAYAVAYPMWLSLLALMVRACRGRERTWILLLPPFSLSYFYDLLLYFPQTYLEKLT